MANTYVPIANIQLTSTATTITFSSIPSTYTDLAIRGSIRTTRVSENFGDVYVRFNGNTSSYSSRRFYRFSAGNGSDTSNWVNANAANQTFAWFSPITMYIANYRNAELYKSWNWTILAPSASNSTAGITFGGGTWSNTSNITEITFYETNGLGFRAESTLTLYGVKNT